MSRATSGTGDFVERLDAERARRHEEWAADLGASHSRSACDDAAALSDVVALTPWVELHAAAAASMRGGEAHGVEVAPLIAAADDTAASVVDHSEGGDFPVATTASIALVVELNRIASLCDANALWAEWRSSAANTDFSRSAFARWLCRCVTEGEELADDAEGREVASVLDLVASMFDATGSGDVARSDIDDGAEFLRQWLCDNSLRDTDKLRATGAHGHGEVRDAVVTSSGATKGDSVPARELPRGGEAKADDAAPPSLLPSSANLLLSRDARFSLRHADCVAVADVRARCGNLAAQLLRSEAAAFEDVGGRVAVAPSEPIAKLPFDGAGAQPAGEDAPASWGIGLRPSDVVYPVCEDGLYASQALAHVVRTLYPAYRDTASTPLSEAAYNIDVRPPHGALHGFDPYWRTTTTTTSLQEEAATGARCQIAPDYSHAPAWPWYGGGAELRAACFARATGGAALEPRAGESFCSAHGSVIGADPQQPEEWRHLNEGRDVMREFFSTSYFAPLKKSRTTSTRRRTTSSRPVDVEEEETAAVHDTQLCAPRRRVYICLGTATLAVVLRRLIEVHGASVRADNVVLVCIPFSDRVARAGSKAQLECFGSAVPPAAVIESAVACAISALRSVVLREEQCALPEARVAVH